MAILQPRRLLADVEWRVYIGVLLAATILVVAIGLYCGDFDGRGGDLYTGDAVRYGLFQVVSIMTTTGFCTDDFDSWNSFGRGVLLLLMFVGGSPGSTAGGLIRVAASDGYHTGLGTSAAFLVPNRPPRPYIVSPDSRRTYPATDPVSLQGGAIDAEEGALEEGAQEGAMA